MSTLAQQRTRPVRSWVRGAADVQTRALAAGLAAIGAGLATVALLGPLATGLIDMFLQYILGPDYASLPGNNERAFPLFVVLFTAGWLVALAAWRPLSAETLSGTRRRDRTIAGVLGILAFLTFVRYLPALADWMSAKPEDSPTANAANASPSAVMNRSLLSDR